MIMTMIRIVSNLREEIGNQIFSAQILRQIILSTEGV